MKPDRKLLFCNVDIDTDLAGSRSPRQRQSCIDALFYFYPCGGPEDRILLDTTVPESYKTYLSGLGLPIPRECSDGEILSDHTAYPWGWSATAVSRFLRYDARVRHPPLETVRTVNGRRFCHEITKRHGLGIVESALCESAAEAHAWIRSCRTFPLVLKPEYGNAGIGLIRIGSREEAQCSIEKTPIEPISMIDRGFSQPGTTAVIETWVNRSADLSSRFELDESGCIRAITHQRALNNQAGVYFGNLLDPADPLVARWRRRMDEGVSIIAQELHAAGYFGPAGLDWVLYEDNGKESCSLVDINARQTMSFPSHMLRNRLSPEKPCLLLLAPRRRHPSLSDYASWYRHCGNSAFDPKRGTGILIFTPLSYSAGGTEYRPLRHGFFIAGNTREEVFEYDRRLRLAFKRK